MTGDLTVTKATILAPPEKLLTDMTALQEQAKTAHLSNVQLRYTFDCDV